MGICRTHQTNACLRLFVPADPAGVETLGPVLIAPDGKNVAHGYHRNLADLYLVEGLR